MAIFHGLSAFPITPATADGQILVNDLAAILAPLKTAGVHSIGLLGSTGAYAYLDRAARQQAVTIAADCLGGAVPLIVGVGSLRTDDAVRLAQDAAGSGADALLMAPMSYTPMTQDEAYHHYVTVAGATDLPMCIYNNPATTHFEFGTDLLSRLAAVPTITAVKMPKPADVAIADDLAILRAALPAGFLIGYSADWCCGDAFLAGADTFYSGLAGILPDEMAQLALAAQQRDTKRTAAINAQFAPLWTLLQTYGTFRVVYAIARLKGLTQALPPRPILPMPDIAQGALASALAMARLIPVETRKS